MALECVKNFIVKIKILFGKDIKIIRSDNRGEFKSHPFRHILEKYEITHQLSCPYTPQKNATVEKKHRHLLDG